MSNYRNESRVERLLLGILVLVVIASVFVMVRGRSADLGACDDPNARNVVCVLDATYERPASAP